LLLDEPLGALDARLRLELRGELRRFAKENGLTVIHVTQDQDEAMAIADRIALLKEGKITQIGTSSEMYLHPTSPFVMNFIEGTNFLEAYVEDKKDNVVDLVIENTYYRVKAYGEFTVGERVLVCLRPSSIKMVKRKGGQLFAQILHRTIMGSYVVIEADLFGPNKPISIETTFKDAIRFKDNDIVSLNVDINDLKIYRYPLLGFIKEVEVSI
jgi:ABC-type Fe3+/spermidine/putrescine transport system ATPase subunit